MVALQILVLPAQVRILVPQPNRFFRLAKKKKRVTAPSFFYYNDSELERSLYLDDVEGLDDVSIVDVVIAGDTHTAFLTCTHFLHGILADLK